MRTLVYKRTHHGDPDSGGRFGINDCMGRVRAWDYGSVIGIGGIGSEPESLGIAGKVTWIGIGPTKICTPGRRGPIVTFERFLYFGAGGPGLAALAPNLAARMYGSNVRVLLKGVTAIEQQEIDRVLALACGAPPSPASGQSTSSSSNCRPMSSTRCAGNPTAVAPPVCKRRCRNATMAPSTPVLQTCSRTDSSAPTGKRTEIGIATPRGSAGCRSRIG